MVSEDEINFRRF